ncbi:MAG: hypothetical protein ACRDMV_14850 [Streptosporangiales bacterium]
MAVLHKLAAGAALAALGTFGFASAANAAVDDHHKRWYAVEDNGSLVKISDNNVGPFQVCHNNVPVNVVGGQVPLSDIVGVLGIGSDGNWTTQVHNCDQDTTQNNDGKTSKHWYRVDDDGGLIEVSDNNVGPFQVCNNNVPVNGVGVQVPVDDVTGIIGIGSDGNSATLVESCDQDTTQNNDGPNPTEPSNPTPSESTPSTSNPSPSESTPSTSNPTPSESTPSTSNPSPSETDNAPQPTPVETNAPVTG